MSLSKHGAKLHKLFQFAAIVDENVGLLWSSWGNGGRLRVKDMRRMPLWADCWASVRFANGLCGAVGMNGRRGGIEGIESIEIRVSE